MKYALIIALLLIPAIANASIDFYSSAAGQWIRFRIMPDGIGLVLPDSSEMEWWRDTVGGSALVQVQLNSNNWRSEGRGLYSVLDTFRNAGNAVEYFCDTVINAIVVLGDVARPFTAFTCSTVAGHAGDLPRDVTGWFVRWRSGKNKGRTGQVSLYNATAAARTDSLTLAIGAEYWGGATTTSNDSIKVGDTLGLFRWEIVQAVNVLTAPSGGSSDTTNIKSALAPSFAACSLSIRHAVHDSIPGGWAAVWTQTTRTLTAGVWQSDTANWKLAYAAYYAAQRGDTAIAHNANVNAILATTTARDSSHAIQLGLPGYINAGVAIVRTFSDSLTNTIHADTLANARAVWSNISRTITGGNILYCDSVRRVNEVGNTILLGNGALIDIWNYSYEGGRTLSPSGNQAVADSVWMYSVVPYPYNMQGLLQNWYTQDTTLLSIIYQIDTTLWGHTVPHVPFSTDSLVTLHHGSGNYNVGTVDTHAVGIAAGNHVTSDHGSGSYNVGTVDTHAVGIAAGNHVTSDHGSGSYTFVAAPTAAQNAHAVWDTLSTHQTGTWSAVTTCPSLWSLTQLDSMFRGNHGTGQYDAVTTCPTCPATDYTRIADSIRAATANLATVATVIAQTDTIIDSCRTPASVSVNYELIARRVMDSLDADYGVNDSVLRTNPVIVCPGGSIPLTVHVFRSTDSALVSGASVSAYPLDYGVLTTSGETNANGYAHLGVDSGYVAILVSKDNYFSVFDTFHAAFTETISIYLSPLFISTPISPDYCAIWGTIIPAVLGESVTKYSIVIQPIPGAPQFFGNGVLIQDQYGPYNPDSTGLWSISVPRGAKIKITINGGKYTQSGTVPDSSVCNYRSVR